MITGECQLGSAWAGSRSDYSLEGVTVGTVLEKPVLECSAPSDVMTGLLVSEYAKDIPLKIQNKMVKIGLKKTGHWTS